MALLSSFSQKEHFVKTIFDNFAQDVSFKDLVFLVGDNKLAYHSQVLRNVFPFLKNFLPNPGTSCPCETFISSSSSMFVTLDGVSPKTLSTLMSSIYNRNKPIFISMEEMEKVKELLIMLGADPGKYNICLDTSADKNAVQTDINETVQKESYDLDKMAGKVDKSKSEELLLDENLTESCEVDTVNEAMMEDCQREGSFSSTVPHDEGSSDLDESVADEEITFTNQEEESVMDESLSSDELDNSSTNQYQVQPDKGVSVLDMVEDFMNEDDDGITNHTSVKKNQMVEVDLPVKNDNSNTSLIDKVVDAEKSEDNLEHLEIDDDIEVVAEVVDGVTETVIEVTEQLNGNQNHSKIIKHCDVDIIEDRIDEEETAPSSKDNGDLEIMVNDKVKDMQESRGIDSSETVEKEEIVGLAEARQDSKSNKVGVNEVDLEISKVNKEVDLKVYNDSEMVDGTLEDEVIQDHVLERDSDMDGDCNQEAVNEAESYGSKSANLNAMDNVLIEDKSSFDAYEQNESNQENEEEEFDYDLIYEEEEEEVAAALEVCEGASSKDKVANQEDHESTEVASTGSSKKTRNFSEEANENNMSKESLAVKSVDVKLDGDQSDDSENEDFDLENLSVPLEEVKKVKRNLSESFDMDDEKDSNSNDPEMKETTECVSVAVIFKGDDLEMIKDISISKKRALSEEDLLLENDDKVKKVKVDDEVSEDEESSAYEESSEEEASHKKDYVRHSVPKETESVEEVKDHVVERTTTDDLSSYNEEEVKEGDGQAIGLLVKRNKMVESSDESENEMPVKKNRIVESSDEDEKEIVPVKKNKTIVDSSDEDENEILSVKRNKIVEATNEIGKKNVELGEQRLEYGSGESIIQQETSERQSDNEEDPDLFNIDDDDVDMLNEQTKPSTLVTDEQEVDSDKENAKNMLNKQQVLTEGLKQENSSNASVELGKEVSVKTDDFGFVDNDRLISGDEVRTTYGANDDSADESKSTDILPTEDGKSQDPPGLFCNLCPNQTTYKRGQLLMHLTDKHYSKDLLQLYPFTEGSSCQLCIDTSRAKVTTSKTKANYAKHVGTVHEKVLDLVPADLREAILAVSKRKASISTKEADNESLEGLRVQNQVTNGNEIGTIKEESTVDTYPMVTGAKEVKEVQEVKSENVLEKVDNETEGFISGRCPFCPNTKTQFQRSSLLNHLSSTHYNKQLLDAFPYQEGETCRFCVETGRPNPMVARSKPRYVNHMGSLHEKVLDFLPTNLRDSLEDKRKVPARVPRKSMSDKDGQEAAPSYLPSVTRTPLPGPPSLRGPAPGPSTRGPAPGPPMPARSVPGPPHVVPSTRSLPKSLSVSTVPEDRLANLGNLSISKVQEKKPSLPKLANVSISKVE